MSSDDTHAKETKRKQVRYAVSDDCRLRASIRLRSSDAATASKDWAGTLVDLSASGAHIQISLGAVAYQGDGCVIKLGHGLVKTEIRGTLVHYVCSARHSVCGVSIDFSYTGAEQAYQPFYQAIVASALVAGPAGTESAGRHREEYTGPGQAKLVVWRNEAGAGATILGFDYTMARYNASLASVGTDMIANKQQVKFKPAAGGGAALTSAQEAEARWEFSIAGSNLPKVIAPDIRRLLRLVS